MGTWKSTLARVAQARTVNFGMNNYRDTVLRMRKLLQSMIRLVIRCLVDDRDRILRMKRSPATSKELWRWMSFVPYNGTDYFAKAGIILKRLFYISLLDRDAIFEMMVGIVQGCSI